MKSGSLAPPAGHQCVWMDKVFPLPQYSII